MNWSDIGSAGSLLGALGVIASVVYLSLQIKHQVRESRVTAVHLLTENFREFLMALATNEQLASIWMRGLKDFAALSPDERLRLSSALGNAFRIFDTLYTYFDEGFVDEQAWATLEAPVDDLIAYPGIQAWWETRRHWYSAAYRARVDEKVARATAPAMYGEAAAR